MDLVRQHFYEVSLEYVFKVQEVQERKMFEFVEPVSELSACTQLGWRGEMGSRGALAVQGPGAASCITPQPPHRAGLRGGSSVGASGHRAIGSASLCVLETFELLIFCCGDSPSVRDGLSSLCE